MKKKMIFATLLSLVLAGCSGFLDRESDSFIDKDKTYTSYERTSKALVNIYRYLPEGLGRLDSNAMNDAATDDAEFAISTNAVQKFNTGAWNSQYNPDDQWNRLFTGVRLCNEFMENVDRVDLETYRLDPNNATEYKNRLKDLEIWKYEARFLRAFFNFELLKRYGGIPIVKKTLPVTGNELKEYDRASIEDVVEFIVEDCDSAAAHLELSPWRDNASAYGHATKGAALALKSRTLLYAASPLYLDGDNLDEAYLPTDKDKWKKAADAAKEVIDLGVYSLYGNYGELFANNMTNNEFIFQKRYANSVNFETTNFPVSFGGKGGTAPSLNLMEAYELKDGSKFSWDNGESSAHPFVWRDSRLRATFVVNGDPWKDGTVQSYDNGKDGRFSTNATRTGFYLRKFQNEDVNVQTGGNALGHIWPYFRLAEIYLNYAEALNEYNPGDENILQYLNFVRKRSGQPSVKTALSQEDMREKIRNERRVELAFEDHRAWDVRRWKIASSTLGSPLRGLGITPSSVKSLSRLAVPSTEVPAGWYWYDGDEFNASSIDNSYWGLYGNDSPVGNSTYGQPTGNIQTYRAAQASIVKEGNTSFVRLHSTKDGNPPHPTNANTSSREGWWAGALSSRDSDKYGYAGKYYPLFSRIEIRAKVPYKYGIWNGLWCRYYAGASYAELDIEEFFVKTWENDANPTRLSQALHLHDNDKGKEVNESTLGVNVNGYGRHTILNFDPGKEYHVYGVQIDPDPDAPKEHAIISYLLDGKVTNTLKTKDYGNRYNEFVLKAFREGREKTAWDIAITAQIGGWDANGIGYPEDRDKNLREVDMDIDWVRVYTRENSDPDQPDAPSWPAKEGFSYAPFTVEQRVFEPRMYWYPVPETEMLQTNWTQNPQW